MSEIEATVSETPMRDYQSALIALQEQLAKDNNDVAALEKIGGIYLKVGQIDQAIGHFKDCIKRAGSLPKYYLNLGHAHKTQVRNPISAKSLGSGLQYKQQVLAHLPQIAAIKHQANAWFLGA
ncbi:MAG: hypothetical protein O2949_11985 [Proteobacteria bacterium]|nr:hypothetical protein [Pseudomonadota bacterium]